MARLLRSDSTRPPNKANYTLMLSAERILFFDGDCGLCRRSVRILMKQDRKERICFAPLQGETAKERLPESLRTDLDSVVYHTADGRSLIRSQALIHFLIDSEGFLSWLAKPLACLPSRFLDRAYDSIAKRRYKLAPRKTCPLPVSKESKRFLP